MLMQTVSNYSVQNGPLTDPDINAYSGIVPRWRTGPADGVHEELPGKSRRIDSSAFFRIRSTVVAQAYDTLLYIISFNGRITLCISRTRFTNKIALPSN